jgi:xanthine dehydrogenase accessory factor
MREILAELTGALDEGRECVFCSLVETRGSTPQKAGAAMLVFADGSQSGTLGGGCVEAEVKQRALRLLGATQPEVLTFHLDDNYGWDDGLICGGRMSILTQPLGQRSVQLDSRDYFRVYRTMVESGRGCTEAVTIGPLEDLVVGTRFLFDPAGALVAQLPAARVPGAVVEPLTRLRGRPRPFTQGGVAYLPVAPRTTLLIVGGGHVGQAVGRLAAEADFDVWVLDDREHYASPERFPQAHRRLVGDIGRTLKEQKDQITATTFAIIVTRGHAHDEEALYHLATTAASYVGMIGSKRKIRLIFDDLIARGIPRAALDRVHAPLGLEIGSQTVPEIAVSIVAELIACRNLGNSTPRSLRNATTVPCDV